MGGLWLVVPGTGPGEVSAERTKSLPGREDAASEAPWEVAGRATARPMAPLCRVGTCGQPRRRTPQCGDSRGGWTWALGGVRRAHGGGSLAHSGAALAGPPAPSDPPISQAPHTNLTGAVAGIIPAAAPAGIRAPAPEASAAPEWCEAGGLGTPGPRARQRDSGPGWAIPSPSSRRPDQRAERDGSSGNALPPLEAAREVGSADGPDDGDPGRSRSRASSIPEPECPAGG